MFYGSLIKSRQIIEQVAANFILKRPAFMMHVRACGLAGDGGLSEGLVKYGHFTVFGDILPSSVKYFSVFAVGSSLFFH